MHRATKDFDYCILGAGLAGISLAKELVLKNYSVCLLDTNGIAAGASGVPLGLANYATGRFAKKIWQAEQSYAALLENIELASEYFKEPFYSTNGVLRPSMDEKIASRVKENFENTDWESGWAEWLSDSELKSMNPGIRPDHGGLWLPKAITIDASKYLNYLVSALKARSLSVHEHQSYSHRYENGKWLIEASELPFAAANLIICSGAGSKEFAPFSNYPLHSVKGQLIVLKKDTPVQFIHSISALGYMATLNRQHFVIGSTYEHQYEHNQFDENGKQHLLQIVRNAIPSLLVDASILHSWTGIRVSAPNRMPIMGKHPDYDGLYIFSGLASKGLLFSAHLSSCFAEYLVNDVPLPSEVSIERINPN